MKQVHEWFEAAKESFDSVLLLTPERAHLVIVFASVVLVVIVVQTWLGRRSPLRFSIIAASFAPIVFLFTMLQVPSGYVGVPDENCTKYGGGKLNYDLVMFAPVLKDNDDITGEGWFLVIVRAKERWGNETHLCRLDLRDPKVRALMGYLKQLQLRSGENYSLGRVTFSFGGRNEMPNVIIKGTPPEKKISPPEIAPGREQGT